ncbi:hypothetical protein AB0C29_40140, partial [Actinoplanes sp. NPDC048791]
VVPDRRPAPGPARYPIGAAAWGLAPPAPPAYAPPRKRFPVGEVIMAAVLPIVICSFGSWIYFVYAGIRRQERRQFLFALGYTVLFVVAFVIAASNPSPVESPDLNPTEWIAFTMFAVIAIASAVHGAVLASHPGDSPRSRTLRDQARQFATFDPERARALGIGRPDLMRAFDDGGLVDVNHVPGNELARLPGISSEQAHGIVIDRLNRGPYAQPEDLVIRGVLPMRAVNRLSSKLICLPVAQHGTPPGGWPSPYPSAQHYG